MPDAARTVDTAPFQEAVVDLPPDDLVIATALASAPRQTSVETSPRNTDCLAHQQYRRGPSVYSGVGFGKGLDGTAGPSHFLVLFTSARQIAR